MSNAVIEANVIDVIFKMMHAHHQNQNQNLSPRSSRASAAHQHHRNQKKKKKKKKKKNETKFREIEDIILILYTFNSTCILKYSEFICFSSRHFIINTIFTLYL